MKRNTTPIFKVEVKRGSRPNRNWVQAAEDRASKHSPQSGFSGPAPRAQTARPMDVETVAEVKVARVLPDLLSAEALENRTREQFEHRAAERQNRGRPPVDRSRLPVVSSRAIPGRAVEQQVVEEAAPEPARGRTRSRRGPTPDQELGLQRSTATLDARPEDPVAIPDSAGAVRTRAPVSDAELRSAKRRGQKVVLKPGERWKRRLPRVCW